MGISTLMIFIAIVAIGAVAAVVLLQTANYFRGQAEITREESQSMVLKRLDVISVVGFVDKNVDSPTYNKVILLKITVRVPPSGKPVDFRDVVLEYTPKGPNSALNYRTATFIDVTDGDVESTPANFCKDWSEQKIFEAIRGDVLSQYSPEVSIQFRDGYFYGVGWTLCKKDKDDPRLIVPEELASIFYMPPGGLSPDSSFVVNLIVRDGGTTQYELRTPDTFTGDVVIISIR